MVVMTSLQQDAKRKLEDFFGDDEGENEDG
jgi:hypothetical protein